MTAEAFVLAPSPREPRHVAWFHELDAWTEYWDIYHPETRGRYYFGDDRGELGLLSRFLPRQSYPPPFTAWTRMALASGSRDAFVAEIRTPEVADAVREVDALVARIFGDHFGPADDRAVQLDYLDATFRFAIDALPPATERAARIPAGDWRHATAGRHALDSDVMWFAWALHLEAASTLAGSGGDHARRALMMAGVATGCAANFAWRGHRRTRAEYRADAATHRLLRERGLAWAGDLDAGAAEVHALYRTREWGAPD
jgi:hypothetical protein